MKLFKSFFLVLLFLSTFSSIAQVSWRLDPSHGHFGFSIKYMLIGDYEGHFKSYDGKVSTKTETDLTDAVFSISIDMNMVGAEVGGHEDMLKSSDFFDVANYPSAFFRSTSMKPGKLKGTYDLEGDLMIRGISKKVKLLVTPADKPVINPYFKTMNYGIKITGTIKRSDYGVGDYTLMDGEGLVLGDEVNLNCALILKKAEQVIPMVSTTKAIKDEKSWASYVGQYDYGKNFILSISNEQGKLFAKVNPAGYKKFVTT